MRLIRLIFWAQRTSGKLIGSGSRFWGCHVFDHLPELENFFRKFCCDSLKSNHLKQDASDFPARLEVLLLPWMFPYSTLKL
jgi:hypothetical protein